MRRRSVSSWVSPGAAGADAAAQSFQVRPLPDQSGQQVLVLRQFYLQLPLAGAGVAPENIQDEGGAVEDFDLQCRFQVALLGGGEFVIADDHIGAVVGQEFLQFGQFALAEVGGGDAVGALGNGGDDFGAGGAGEVAQFVQGVVEAPEGFAGLFGGDGDEYGALGLRAGGLGRALAVA